MFDAYRYNDDDRFIKFRKVAEWFELDKTKNQTWKFHDQKPNQQLMFHIDNLPGEPRKERIESPDFKYARDKTRFLVFLADWVWSDISIWQSYTYTMEKQEKLLLGNGQRYHMQHGMVHGEKDLHYKLQVLQLQRLGKK